MMQLIPVKMFNWANPKMIVLVNFSYNFSMVVAWTLMGCMVCRMFII